MTDQALRAALLHMTLTAVLREGSVPEPLRTEAEAVLAGNHSPSRDPIEGVIGAVTDQGGHWGVALLPDNEAWLSVPKSRWPDVCPGQIITVVPPVALAVREPEDHGNYIGVPVADDPDRQE